MGDAGETIRTCDPGDSALGFLTFSGYPTTHHRSAILWDTVPATWFPERQNVIHV